MVCTVQVTRDMLTESVALIPEFSSYFSFSRLRSGYSGVATYCRTALTPVQAQSGLTQDQISAGAAELRLEFSSEELKGLDSEGRCVMTRHQVELGPDLDLTHLVIINVYCPRADTEKPDREKYKLQFYKALDIRANSLRAAGDLVIVCGDVNTSHREIDHCDPYEEFEDNPGRRFLSHFLKDQRAKSEEKTASKAKSSDGDLRDSWMADNLVVEENQFVDTFRIFHPDREMAFTCWNTKMNCRANNYGTRIDYILASADLAPHFTHCDIQPEVEGSDHCPVLAELALKSLPAAKPPDGCTKYFKEFSGKQVKLSNFFTKTEKPTPVSFTEVKPPPAKRQKVEGKTKITSFFASQNPKPSSHESQPSKQEEKENGPKAPSSVVREKPVETVNNNAKVVWGNIFKAPAPPPLCGKHQEEAVKRKVTKKGPNTGREFWCCARGEGRADDPQARCDFFKWLK